ncbi:MAG: Txe/YoeB family addiction module toxin [Candidatus Symbiothrix sp.]|jgi:toxin YoeB|nr:Txe/YoeB family addiction module toxin [Candidatus Symbiothrix sp.]
MEIIYSPKALHDIEQIKRSGSKIVEKRFERILLSILETPFEGFASPEALKYELAGKWSRELSKKDRVVYQVNGDDIYILSILGHYNDK